MAVSREKDTKRSRDEENHAGSGVGVVGIGDFRFTDSSQNNGS
ncbi:MAG: hypothetical protein U9Q21_01385 [Candidatus Auribacterota bacterium]|nr:hypothetical protein [Candidatus Auribacterota bacterium]